MKKTNKKENQLRGTIIAFLILVIAYLLFGYSLHTDFSSPEQLVKIVSKLIVLPDETPTIATVSDLDKLKDQEFFVDATIGDKVLIFNNSGKAILYSPQKNIIINVAPLSKALEK